MSPAGLLSVLGNGTRHHASAGDPERPRHTRDNASGRDEKDHGSNPTNDGVAPYFLADVPARCSLRRN
ncbi:hypothetical protein N7532_010533 [Penicillium argentinense]|uniref:Uncharacterized protein n=1 Tax=Penicillium argentinense TaxID=1131581 RepID=A0A9W9EPT1_9EURO|nr:uncharacterized protein N7532_010533 [Penicillium argentinense]KAJ5085762.1 hypothetical protein N7532_010533 [Penicillium argentinense]